jgi:aspartate beta-hydroxylase
LAGIFMHLCLKMPANARVTFRKSRKSDPPTKPTFMSNTVASPQQIAALEAKIAQAIQSGQDQDADKMLQQLVTLVPGHVTSLTVLGQRAYKRGDAAAAHHWFQRVTEADGRDPQQWVNVALACQGTKDEAGEEAAITRALQVDAGDLLALILRANFHERHGNTHKAAAAYGAAATVSPPLDRLHPELRGSVAYAMQFKQKYDENCGKFLDDNLAPHYAAHKGEKLDRFRDSVDIMVGRKRRYESQSMMYHYPRLTPIEFFERSEFPWLDKVEAATDDIRDEFMEILKAEKGFTPYITYPNDVPLNQWAELNNSPSWSAFHLYKMGERVQENAAKCPITMSILDGVPKPDQPGRTPAAMFSLLKPKTRIPPHTGVSNARLVTHLPLIVPKDCGFRVGNQTREWLPGKAWVFDDTIEHEAWNESDQLRVVLIFDIWHPSLTLAEREMITAMTVGINAFRGGADEFPL